MRRQYFTWTYLVLAVVLTMYGVFSIVYSLDHEKDIPVLAIVFTAIGGTMLVAFAILYLISVFQKRKRCSESQIIEEEEDEEIEESEPEEIEESKAEEENTEEVEPIEESESNEDEDDFEEVVYERRTSSGFRGGSAYISRVGYGPVLRVSGTEMCAITPTITLKAIWLKKMVVDQYLKYQEIGLKRPLAATYMKYQEMVLIKFLVAFMPQ